MQYGKGILVKIDLDDPESRTVRTCVTQDGSLFLLEITRPILDGEDAQKQSENCCRIVDGRMITAIHLSPESFNAMLQSGIDLVTRIIEAPEDTRYLGAEVELV